MLHTGANLSAFHSPNDSELWLFINKNMNYFDIFQQVELE